MTIQEAVEKHKLDKRRRWYSYSGNVVYTLRYTAPCSGCSCDCSDGHGCSHGNGGCSECGYTGKRRDGVPAPAWDKEGELIEVTDPDFTYFKPLNKTKNGRL